MKKPRKTIPNTKRVWAKGHEYLYFVTGQLNDNGKPILKRLPQPRAPNFGDVYAALTAVKTKRAQIATAGEMTVPQLAVFYEKSPKFKALAASSQERYMIQLNKLRKLLPSAPAGRLLRSDFVRLYDNMADTPGAANLFLAVTSAMYAWGRERGHVDINPCAGIDSFEMGEHEPWPEHILTAALASDDGRIRLATHLLYYTALRIGDVCKLRWTDVRDGAIYVIPQKTARKKRRTTPIRIPLHSVLAAELEGHSKSLGTILAKANGTPWTVDTIRNELQAFALTLGVEVVPHGLRKNAVNSLLEAGCSVAETAAISDQSMQMVEHYAKLRNQSVLGSAAILKWERKK